ncbi:hypothetical protein RCL1_001030 [Eukaryota sp. TZLM3-RCL]
MSINQPFNTSSYCYQHKCYRRSTSILAFNSLRPPPCFRQTSLPKDKTPYVSRPRSKREFDSRLLHNKVLPKVPLVNQRVSVDDLPCEIDDFNLSTKITPKEIQTKDPVLIEKALINSKRFFQTNKNAVLSTRTKKWTNFLQSQVKQRPSTDEGFYKVSSKPLVRLYKPFHDGVLMEVDGEEFYSCCSQGFESIGCKAYKRVGSWSYL